ncbi:hypothetical protein BU23DRAFT_471974, partial [Bimuria novae-zelandiae CBS 107.79]
KPLYKLKKPLLLTTEEAHVMWGHAGKETIERLSENVKGLHISDGQAPKWKDCKTCI